MYENEESVSENGFSKTDPSFNPSNFSMGIELQQQLGLNIDHLSHTQFIQEMGHDLNNSLPYVDQQNWGNEMTYNSFSTQNLNPIDVQNGQQLNFNNSALPGFMNHYPPSLLAKPSFPFPLVNQPVNLENILPTGEQLGPSIVYESRDLFHDSLGNVSSLIGGVDEGIGWEYEIGEGGNRVDYRGKGTTKTKEKIRREQVNDKFQALRRLVPNPTKNDKASIIADAIDYIKELLRTRNELKILVDMRRRERERNKRQKKAQDAGNHEVCNIKPEADDPYSNGESSSLRSSWLQRKSREAEVDVRIVDDEVTIKLAQKKKANCLLFVSKVLDELELDILHVAGGLVGDNFSFLFNTKICEGSCVYASAIANKIIEVVDKQYATIQPGSNF